MKAFNRGIADCVLRMTKEEFYETFTPEEWELLCSNAEFLGVFVAEPFNAEQAEAVANKILNFDSH